MQELPLVFNITLYQGYKGFIYIIFTYILYYPHHNNNNNYVDTYVYTVHNRGADLHFFCVLATVLVQINLQHNQAQPYGICTRVIYLTQTHVYV